MARIKFTADRIANFSCVPGKTQSFFWDTETPGLGIRVTPSGKKTYIIQAKLHGKDIRYPIGDIGIWLLDNKDKGNPGARQEARRIVGLIDQGIDPREHKKQIAAAQAEIKAAREREDSEEKVKSRPISFAWSEYLADRKAHWGELHYQDHVRLAQIGGDKVKRGSRKKKPGPLAPLMNIALADLTPDKIETWIKKETKDRPTQAKLAFRLLRAFLGWCGDHELYKLAIGPNLLTKRTAEVLPKTKAKYDSLQREQLSLWFAAVRQLDNPVIAAYLQGLLLTGARRRELSCLRWEDVDFRWKSLIIRDKVDGERIIPLPPFLENLLRFLPRRNEFVFSSPTSKSGQLMEPTRAHQRALAIAGLEGISLHGLRRSFGSLAEWLEIPTGVIAQIQGHKPSATAEKHYRVRPLDLLRKWHVKYEAWILEQAGIQQSTEQNESVPLKLIASGK